jgi:hypothetical protein
MLEEEEEEGGTSTRIDITHKPWTPFHFYPGCVSVPSSYFFVVTWANSHPFVVPCIQYEGNIIIISKNGFDTPPRVGDKLYSDGHKKRTRERERDSHSVSFRSMARIRLMYLMCIHTRDRYKRRGRRKGVCLVSCLFAHPNTRRSRKVEGG